MLCFLRVPLLAQCRILVSFVYRAGNSFGFVRLALLLPAAPRWVDRCFGFWVFQCSFCLLPVALLDQSTRVHARITNIM